MASFPDFETSPKSAPKANWNSLRTNWLATHAVNELLCISTINSRSMEVSQELLCFLPCTFVLGTATGGKTGNFSIGNMSKRRKVEQKPHISALIGFLTVLSTNEKSTLVQVFQDHLKGFTDTDNYYKKFTSANWNNGDFKHPSLESDGSEWHVFEDTWNKYSRKENFRNKTFYHESNKFQHKFPS